jgi:hypothetical protein
MEKKYIDIQIKWPTKCHELNINKLNNVFLM